MVTGMKGILVALLGFFCTIYLINPTMGWIEIIPDNLPLVGNLDEATATAILLACVRYFGFDIAGFLGSRATAAKRETIGDDSSPGER